MKTVRPIVCTTLMSSATWPHLATGLCTGGTLNFENCLMFSEVKVIMCLCSLKKDLGAVHDRLIKQRSDLEAWLISLGEQHTMYREPKTPTTSIYRQFLTEGANRPPLPLVRVYPEPTANGPKKRRRTKRDAKGFQDGEAKRRRLVSTTSSL